MSSLLYVRSIVPSAGTFSFADCGALRPARYPLRAAIADSAVPVRVTFKGRDDSTCAVHTAADGQSDDWNVVDFLYDDPPSRAAELVRLLDELCRDRTEDRVVRLRGETLRPPAQGVSYLPDKDVHTGCRVRAHTPTSRPCIPAPCAVQHAVQRTETDYRGGTPATDGGP